MATSSGAEGWRAVGVRLSLKMAAQDWGEHQISCCPGDMRMSCVAKDEGGPRPTRSRCWTANHFPAMGQGETSIPVVRWFFAAILLREFTSPAELWWAGCTCDTRHDSSGLGNIHCSVLPRLPWHHAVHATKPPLPRRAMMHCFKALGSKAVAGFTTGSHLHG